MIRSQIHHHVVSFVCFEWLLLHPIPKRCKRIKIENFPLCFVLRFKQLRPPVIIAILSVFRVFVYCLLVKVCLDTPRTLYSLLSSCVMSIINLNYKNVKFATCVRVRNKKHPCNILQAKYGCLNTCLIRLRIYTSRTPASK